MKSILKVLVYICSVAILFFVIDRIAGLVMDKIMAEKSNDKYSCAYRGGINEDIAVFGSSRAARHYAPQAFQDILGYKLMNYGCDGQNIYNHYAVLAMRLNNSSEKPKLVMIEVASKDIRDIPGRNTKYLSVLNPFYDLSNDVKQVLSLKGKSYNYGLRMSKLFKYNSYVHNLAGYLLGIKEGVYKTQGYEPVYKQWNKNIKIIKEDNDIINGRKRSYLIRFIGLCKDNGIPIIILNSPNFVIYDVERTWWKEVKNIAQEYNVPCWDYEQSETFISSPELFNDSYHLNDEGAKLYSSIVASRIKEDFLCAVK